MARRAGGRRVVTEKELDAIMRRFGIKNTYTKLTRQDFRQIMIEDLDVDDLFMIDSIWRVIDKSKSNSIEFSEFVEALSVMLKGSTEALLNFCYRVYDLNENGVITRDEARLLLKSSLSSDVDDFDVDADNTNLNLLLDLTFRKFTKGVDSSSVITFQQYATAFMEEPLLMECFGQILPYREVSDAILWDIEHPHRW